MAVVDAMDIQPDNIMDESLQADTSDISTGVKNVVIQVESVTTILNGEAAGIANGVSPILNGDLQRLSRTGYVYDTRMMDHWPIVDNDDEDDSHPEQPQRIFRIYSILKNNLCIQKMRQISIRHLEKHEAMLVHSEDHWDKVEAIACESLSANGFFMDSTKRVN